MPQILTTDHGDGRNGVRGVGLRRGRDGHVAFTVDREDPPPVAWSGGPDELRWTAERPTDQNPDEG